MSNVATTQGLNPNTQSHVSKPQREGEGGGEGLKNEPSRSVSTEQVTRLPSQKPLKSKNRDRKRVGEREKKGNTNNLCK